MCRPFNVALKAAGPATQIAARGLRVLKTSGYACISEVALERLQYAPSERAARHHLDLLLGTSNVVTAAQLGQIVKIVAKGGPTQAPLLEAMRRGRDKLDEGTLQELCAIANRGGTNQAAIVGLVIDALTAWVTPPPVKAADGKEAAQPPVFTNLPGRASGALQKDVCATLIAFLERSASANAPTAGAAPTPAADVVSRAKSLLVQGGFEAVAPIIADRLTREPPAPVIDVLTVLTPHFTAGDAVEPPAGRGPVRPEQHPGQLSFDA